VPKTLKIVGLGGSLAGNSKSRAALRTALDGAASGGQLTAVLASGGAQASSALVPQSAARRGARPDARARIRRRRRRRTRERLARKNVLVKRLSNGNLLVPARAESDEGVIGDGMVEIGPDDPDYDEWVRQLERQRAPAPPPPGSSSGRPGG
jgi:hypothetical protein